MIKKVLVASDGSKMSRKAVAFATDLAKQLGASITLLGVIDRAYLLTPVVPAGVSPTEIMESTEDLLRQVTQAYLEEDAAECRKQAVEVSMATRTGHPVEEIVKEAESGNADLIVMGSQGRSALQAAVLGSVAYGVIHKDTKVPVLIVRR